jgi:hypothetical protein
MTAIDPTSRSKRDGALRRCKQALIWTFCLESLSWPLRYYEFIIYSYLPPIFYDWGPFLLFFVTISTEIYSLYLPVRYFRTTRIRSIFPFILVVLSHFVISHTSPSNINIMSYHALFRKEREYIATSYCAGKLSLDDGDCDRCLQLPQKWKHLSLMSDHVDIICDKTSSQAMFYTR